MQSTIKGIEDQAELEVGNPQETVLREGARRMLKMAVGHEVDECITGHAHEVDERKH